MPRAKVPAGSALEALRLQRLDLARRELQLLRDVRDRQAERRARASKLLADAVAGDGVAAAQSYSPRCSAWYSCESVKRRRSWFA